GNQEWPPLHELQSMDLTLGSVPAAPESSGRATDRSGSASKLKPLEQLDGGSTMRFGLTTDFRNRPDSGRKTATVYAEIIDHFVLAEDLGFDAVYVFENHFTDDDYMASPMVASTAIAARTKRLRVGPDIAILPLYEPVRVAEDGAVLDLISNGRLDFGVGLGYRPPEYAGYG